MNKRTVFILFMLFVLVGPALAACGGSKSSVAERPTIQLKVGDKTFTENVYSYCWPDAKDNLACNMDETALVQPINKALVTKNDQVHFIINSKVGTPKKFSATLLGGFNDVQDLGATNDAVYNISLQDNLYRVQVDATYDNIEGKPAYVSYVFALELSGVVAAVPTSTPTNTPAPSPTPTETPVPTATFTPKPTLTPKPTETVQPTTTPAPTRTASVGASPAVTTPTETPPPPGDLGERAIFGTVQVLSAGGNVALAGAQVSYTHSSMARPERGSSGTVTTDANGQFTFSPILIHDTDQIVVSVQAPGYEPQTIQRSGIDTWNAGGVFNFVLTASQGPTPVPPVTTATPTALPTTAPNIVPTTAPTLTAAPPPTAAAVPQATSTAVPPLALEIAGRDSLPVGYQFCQRSASGERVCVELPAATSSAERLQLLRGSAAQVKIGGDRPAEVDIAYLSDSGQMTGQPETRPGDNILLLTITPEPGSYILSIHVTWAAEDATYFFRVTVSN